MAGICIHFDVTNPPNKFDVNTLSISAQRRCELYDVTDKNDAFINSLSNNIKYGLIKRENVLNHV